MGLVQLIFITTVTVTTFAISILTAKIYALGFHLSTNSTRNLIILSVIGPLLFVGTMFIGRFVKSNILTSVSYYTNAIGGIIFYLFVLGLLLGIVLLVGRIFSFSIPVFIASIFLTLGFVFGVAGLIQARFIKIVYYDVVLAGAPSSWDGKRGLLVSDTHFGLVNHKKFSDKVVNKILEIKPDFVLHAGDFYDGPANDTTLITESWGKLASSIPVFYAPGNHEEYGDYAGFLTSIRNAGITALVDNTTEYEGVGIAGIGFREKRQEIVADKVIKNLKVDQNKPLILINHHPAFQKSAMSVGTDLMVSGHTHRGQFWPLNYIVKAVYGKYIYGLNTDDTITTLTTSGVGTAGPPMRLFNSPELVIINFKTK